MNIIIIACMISTSIQIQNIKAVGKLMERLEYKIDTNIILQHHIQHMKENDDCDIGDGPTCQLIKKNNLYREDSQYLQLNKYKQLKEQVKINNILLEQKINQYSNENSLNYYIQSDSNRYILDKMREDTDKIQEWGRKAGIKDNQVLIDLTGVMATLNIKLEGEQQKYNVEVVKSNNNIDIKFNKKVQLKVINIESNQKQQQYQVQGILENKSVFNKQGELQQKHNYIVISQKQLITQLTFNADLQVNYIIIEYDNEKQNNADNDIIEKKKDKLEQLEVISKKLQGKLKDTLQKLNINDIEGVLNVDLTEYGLLDDNQLLAQLYEEL